MTDCPDLRAALEKLLRYVDDNTCVHETTKRGGSIWTICEDCGRKWADDEGGFVPHQDATEVAAAREVLAAIPPRTLVPDELGRAVALVKYYRRRGVEDLGIGEVERLLEAAERLSAVQSPPLPDEAAEAKDDLHQTVWEMLEDQEMTPFTDEFGTDCYAVPVKAFEAVAAAYALANGACAGVIETNRSLAALEVGGDGNSSLRASPVRQDTQPETDNSGAAQ
jgi:hypothetical protein